MSLAGVRRARQCSVGKRGNCEGWERGNCVGRDRESCVGWVGWGGFRWLRRERLTTGYHCRLPSGAGGGAGRLLMNYEL